ncbi:NAD(P)-dependent oxidoreductase [Candidatus Roizmanbacteria bacterium]|nr:NAD(P)-dependent oxidoreductase [Candidatus Roizmanbacteria bacterium]
MDKIKIIGTGLSGMIGSKITELLGEKYSFEDLSYDTGVDIRDRNVIFERVQKSGAPIVFHMAAKADVDGCEKDKQEDMKYLQDPNEVTRFDLKSVEWRNWMDKNTAFAINVVGTKNIVEACRKYNKTLIYISTDFVFDGTKSTAYIESDKPNPTSWYSRTKYLGEQIVQQFLTSYSILRPAYPYGTTSTIKKDFVRNIQSRLANRKKVSCITDNLFTPTFVPDIAGALDVLIQKKAQGIYHLVGSTALSSYEAVVAIAKHFGYDSTLLEKTTNTEYYSGRAPRPRYLAISNEKITALGVSMKTFEEGLKLIRE